MLPSRSLGTGIGKGERNMHLKNTQKTKKAISTKVEEDVLSDARVMGKSRFSVEAEQLLENLWEVNPDLHEILQQADTLEKARDGVYTYLDKLERCVFELDNPLHVLENAIVRDAVRVFRSIIGPINERRTGESALDCLWKLANERRAELKRAYRLLYRTNLNISQAMERIEQEIPPSDNLQYLLDFIRHTRDGRAGRQLDR